VKGIIDSVRSIGHAELKKNGVFIVPGSCAWWCQEAGHQGAQASTPSRRTTVFKAKPSRKVIKDRR